MMPVSIVIPKGARLRLIVTSSDYPAINRNLNTGQVTRPHMGIHIQS